MKNFLFVVIALGLLSPLSFLEAQTPCGNIIAPENIYDWNSPIVSTPIEDCSDPFGETIGVASPYILKIDGLPIAENATATVAEGGTTNFRVTGNPLLNNVIHRYYAHDGNDYRLLNTDGSQPTEDDYRAMALEFFTQGTDVEPYVQAAITGEYSFETEDEEDLFADYMDYSYEHFVPVLPKLTAGTYTLVSEEFLLVETKANIFQRIFAHIVPIAHAQTFPKNIFTLAFTVTETSPEPLGASSVLFLPGIMGSRLYEESTECGFGSGEKERWMSIDDCNQLRLSTNEQGQSVNDIYTKDGNQSVIDEVSVFNLYKSFFSALEGWKDDEEIIEDYVAIPYDWRLRLDDLLKSQKNEVTGEIRVVPDSSITDSYLYTQLEALAEDSNNHKVTIVTHSNGGLLAKAFLATLQEMNDPLLSKIDTLIMVGSPQLGTPSTLLGMLHGDEIGPWGSVVSQQTTRTLMNTMPFAFHLLPSESYFDSAGVTVDTPVVTFEDGTITTPLANQFGSTIDDATTLQNFLSTNSGRTKPEVDDLVNPEVVSPYLFNNYTQDIDELMNQWVPPPTMQVKEIAGVGLSTQSGLTYFTDSTCIARDPLKLFRCTAYEPKLGMRPNDTIDGDATVVTPSALGMSGTYSNVERWWLDLESYNRDSVFDRVHKDIFEVQDIIDFVYNTILATSSLPYEYLINTPTNLSQENRLVFNLHSPLDLSVASDNGEVVSSSTQSIEGGVYKRFGEVQHISIPNTEENIKVLLRGISTGSFTFEIEEYSAGELDTRHSYKAIPSSTSTQVTMIINKAMPIENTPLVVDYNGDGVADTSYDVNGEIVPKITYENLLSVISALPIKPLYKKLLLENAKIAKRYHEKSFTQAKYKKLELITLYALKKQITLYSHAKIIIPADVSELLEIVNSLLNN